MSEPTPQSLISDLPPTLIQAGELNGHLAQRWLENSVRLATQLPLARLRGDQRVLTELLSQIRGASVGFNVIMAMEGERLRQCMAARLALGHVLDRLYGTSANYGMTEIRAGLEGRTGEEQATLACLRRLISADVPEGTTAGVRRDDWISALSALIRTADAAEITGHWAELTSGLQWSDAELIRITQLLGSVNLPLPESLRHFPEAAWLLAAQTNDPDLAPNDLNTHERALSGADEALRALIRASESEADPTRSGLRLRLLSLRLLRHRHPDVRIVAYGVINSRLMSLPNNRLCSGDQLLKAPPVSSNHIMSLMSSAAAQAEAEGKAGQTLDPYFTLRCLNHLRFGDRIPLRSELILMSALIAAYGMIRAPHATGTDYQTRLKLALSAWESGLVAGLKGEINLPASVVCAALSEWEAERQSAEQVN